MSTISTESSLMTPSATRMFIAYGAAQLHLLTLYQGFPIPLDNGSGRLCWREDQVHIWRQKRDEALLQGVQQAIGLPAF